MNTTKLSLSSLRFHALSNAFNVLVLALGIATIITLLRLSTQVEDRFGRDLEGIDLVVGAKGSPLQLILSSVFHLDVPTGNIPLKDAETLEKNPLVKSAIPLALGDSYEGFRIVGTTADYARHYHATLAAGDYGSDDMEAVLGSEAARTSHLQVGQTFIGSHGLTAGGEEHTQFPYKVTGILAPTGSVIDRLVLVSIGSVWRVHEHPDADEKETQPHAGKEVTALLITYTSPLAVASLPRFIDKTPTMQAASPALETAKLFRLLGAGSDAVRLLGILLMGMAGVGFFVTLFHAASDRSYDIALLRALGATRMRIFSFVLMEGLILGLVGTALGFALGHIMAWGAQHFIEAAQHMRLSSPRMEPHEGWIALAALGISILAACIPAWIACRVNVARLLAKGA